MSKIDSLEIFSEVIKQRNFSSAALRLNITPSAVSKQIGQLEKRLGVQLFNRTTRSVSPTEAGELYFNQVRQTLEALHEAESLIADMDTTPRGTLKIAAEPIFGRAILARIIAAYGEAYPEVNIELFLTDHSIEKVKSGFDLGIHLGDLHDDALTSTTISDHRVSLCASIAYLDCYGEPKTIEDLPNHKLIKISAIEFHQVRQLDDFYEHINYKQNINYELNKGFSRFHLTVNDIEMAYQSALVGIGIVPLPNYLVNPQIEIGVLKQVLPSLITSAHPVQLFHQNGRHLSKKIETFSAFIIDYLRP
ncbi:MAG: LysR family transcriptional regulator for bpeEF and oprC [Candidatus Azotimanducaceae bacterium]